MHNKNAIWLYKMVTFYNLQYENQNNDYGNKALKDK